MTPSSRGLGHRPFTAVTRVRLPLGSPTKPPKRWFFFMSFFQSYPCRVFQYHQPKWCFFYPSFQRPSLFQKVAGVFVWRFNKKVPQKYGLLRSKVSGHKKNARGALSSAHANLPIKKRPVKRRFFTINHVFLSYFD